MASHFRPVSLIQSRLGKPSLWLASVLVAGSAWSDPPRATGVVSVPKPATLIAFQEPVAQVTVDFPVPFGRLPAMHVSPIARQDLRLQITRINTNRFGVEVPLIRDLQMETEWIYASSEGTASLTDRLPFETSFGLVNGRQALIGLDPAAPEADRLFISLAGAEAGLRFWQAQRVDMTPLLGQSGHPWAAGLVDGRMAVLWTGPQGLCLSRSADAFGQLPWSTEVLTTEAPRFERASFVEAGHEILIGLAQLETNSNRSGWAHLSCWRRPLGGGAKEWTHKSVAAIEIPPGDEPSDEMMAVRASWFGSQLMLSFTLERAYTYGSGTFASQSTDSIQGLYFTDSSEPMARWTLVPSQDWSSETFGQDHTERVSGGYRAQGPNGVWKFGPLDQWLELNGRPEKLSREYLVAGTGPWLGGALAPTLNRLPEQIRWTASESPWMEWIYSGGSLTAFEASGIPRLFGDTGECRVLRSGSLSNPAWQEVGRVQPDSSGSIYYTEGSRPGEEAAFYRIEELR